MATEKGLSPEAVRVRSLPILEAFCLEITTASAYMCIFTVVANDLYAPVLFICDGAWNISIGWYNQ